MTCNRRGGNPSPSSPFAPSARTLRHEIAAMPNRQDRRGRSKTAGPFVQLHHWMLRSAAYRDLTPAARALFTELVMIYDGKNNGFIALSARDAARRCRVNKDTATRAFRELIEHGFIECVTPGGFSRKVRHATEWRLTHLQCDKTGGAPSKGFMRWPTMQTAVPNKGQHGPVSGTAFKPIGSLVNGHVPHSGP